MQLLTSIRSAVLLVIAYCAVPLVGHAQTASGDALGFKLGETDLFPSLRLDYLQNSNAFLEPDNEISTNEVTVSPQLLWVADRRLVSLEASYNGEYNSSSEEALNYIDHKLALAVDSELNSRKQVTGDISWNIGREELGLNLTRGLSINDDEVTFSDIQAEGNFRYGASNARGNMSAGLFLQNFNYTSRDDVTSGLGYSKFEPYAEFSLRLSGDTRLLSQLRFSAVNFENDLYDRNDLSLLLGLQFDVTGKSGGTVRAGVVQSQYASIEDKSEFIVSGSLFWEPSSFARLELVGWRELDNSGGSIVANDDISSVVDFVQLRWLHTWSSRVSHVATVQSQSYTRICPNLDSNTISGSFEMNVQITRWLSMGFNGSTTSREVPSCAGIDNVSLDQDYDRTRVGVHMQATL